MRFGKAWKEKVMSYSHKFVVAVKVGGEFMNELANGTVILPFAAEYSIYMKNKNTRNAVAQIFVDGENVSGNGYLVPAGQAIEIERHADTPKKFRFVSLDSYQAYAEGKNGPNDDKVKGLVEVRFFFEKEKPKVVEVHHHHHHDHWTPRPPYPRPYEPRWLASNEGLSRSADAADFADYGPAEACASASETPTVGTFSLNDGVRTRGAIGRTPPPELKDGCTVEGGYSGQRFGTVQMELETEYTSIKLFLQGQEKPAYQVEPAIDSVTVLRERNREMEELLKQQEDLRKRMQELLKS